MVDRSLIKRKLILLDAAKKALERYPISSLKEFKKSHLLQKGVEKTLQEMIEICMDIGKHIIADEGFGFPEDGKAIFRILAEHDVVSTSTADLLIHMVGFRNLIVHLYETIDVDVVYTIWKKKLGDFDRFVADIQTFLKKQD